MNKFKLLNNIRNSEMKQFIIGILFIVSVSACDLDENPVGQYTTDKYYTSVSKLEVAVLNVYTVLQRTETYGAVYFCAFDNDTDLSHVTGTESVSGYRAIGHYFLENNFPEIENYWKYMYEGINYTNEILHYAGNVPASNEVDIKKKAKLIAETKFLRAFLYFELVRLFGDVPLKLDISIYGDNFKIARTSKDEVYDRIVKDMEEAIPDMPWYYENSSNDGRPTKNSAIGLLSRIQLFRGGYSLFQDGQIHRSENYMEFYHQVDSLTKKLITDGKNELNPNYEQVFKNQCQYVIDPKEDIFELDFTYKLGVLQSSRFGTTNGTTVKKAGIYNTNYTKWVVTQGFAYNYFESSDLRKDVSISTFQYDENGTRVNIAGTGSYNWTPGKWKREYQTDADKSSNNFTSINIVLMRYSDVLLMRAEALNEINGAPTAEAYELVNMVRRRGFGQPISTPNSTVDMPSGMDKDQFLKYIQDERARELAFEPGIRRQDLLRWNILGQKLKELRQFQTDNPTLMGTYTYVAVDNFNDGQSDVNFHKHELYPIPYRELQENKNLVQNPNYPL